MKRFLPVVLVLVLTLTLATPALAAGKGKAPFTLVGTITALDAAAQTVTVQVLRGNTLVKPYLNQSVTLKARTATVFRYTDGVTTSTITFADLKVGAALSASGTLAGSLWTASRITIGARLDCLK